jgi:Fe-S-cluster containining protein
MLGGWPSFPRGGPVFVWCDPGSPAMLYSMAQTSPDHLQFSCISGCTRCCEQKGWVYLTEQDLRQAARHLKMTAAEFERRFVYRTRHRIRLRKPRGSQCHFLNSQGCTIHPAKPTQCRLFPFWPELVAERRQWRETAKYCPGIGQGELVQIGTAVETAHEMTLAYPHYYQSGERNKTSKS